MKTVPLHGGKAAGRVALVDDEDYELVSRYRWHVLENINPGRRSNGPYVKTNTWHAGQPGMISMHTLITGWPRVDHVNHDGLDNTRKNLRPVTPGQNSANRRPNLGAASAYKGVNWRKNRSRWVALIRANGKVRYLGQFASEEDAARAYDEAALAAWSEYACLNFPRS